MYELVVCVDSATSRDSVGVTTGCWSNLVLIPDRIEYFVRTVEAPRGNLFRQLNIQAS